MPQGREPPSVRPGKLSPHEAARRSWLLSEMPIRKRRLQHGKGADVEVFAGKGSSCEDFARP